MRKYGSRSLTKGKHEVMRQRQEAARTERLEEQRRARKAEEAERRRLEREEEARLRL